MNACVLAVTSGPGTTYDAEIRAVATEFVREETAHVEELERGIEQEEAKLRAAAAAPA